MNLQTYPVATLVTHSEEITAAGRSVAGGFLPNKCLGSTPVLEHVDELLEDAALPAPSGSTENSFVQGDRVLSSD